jgi:hypothetical protein
VPEVRSVGSHYIGGSRFRANTTRDDGGRSEGPCANPRLSSALAAKTAGDSEPFSKCWIAAVFSDVRA